jgi:DNA-directed RNA polymerase subunit beta
MTLIEHRVEEVDLLSISPRNIGPSFRDTLEMDRINSPEQAMIEVYKKMKPGDPPTLEAASNMLQNFFFNEERYSLSKVGRLKINKKLGLEYPLDHLTLTHDDILKGIKHKVFEEGTLIPF